jgi:hypothetical protein
MPTPKQRLILTFLSWRWFVRWYMLGVTSQKSTITRSPPREPKITYLFGSFKRFPHQNSVRIVCYPVYRSMYCPLENKPHPKEKLKTNACEVSRLTLVIIDVIWMMTWHGKWMHHVWAEVQAAGEFIRAGISQNERKRRLKTWESGVRQ